MRLTKKKKKNSFDDISGVQVNKEDRAGQHTALYLAAAETRNLEVVKILASHGADLNASCSGARHVTLKLFENKVAKNKVEGGRDSTATIWRG